MVFVITKLLILILLYSSHPFEFTKTVHYLGVHGLLNVFTSYDSQWYLAIAQHGYYAIFLTAFFPLYPLLIYLGHFVFHSYALSGVAISWIANLWTGFVLVKIVRLKSYPLSEKKLLWLFYLSPIAVFMSSVYSESLFLLVTLWGWYLIQRKQWWLAGIVTGLAIWTRNFGVVFGVIGMLEVFLISREWSSLIKYAIPPFIMGLFFLAWQWMTTGNPITFSIVEKTIWGREFRLPFWSIYHDLIALFLYNLSTVAEFGILINTMIVLFSFFIIGLLIREKQSMMALYLLMGELVAMCSPLVQANTYQHGVVSLSSLPIIAGYSVGLGRYVMGLFPIYFIFIKKTTIFDFILSFYAGIAILATVAFGLKIFIG